MVQQLLYSPRIPLYTTGAAMTNYTLLQGTEVVFRNKDQTNGIKAIVNTNINASAQYLQDKIFKLYNERVELEDEIEAKKQELAETQAGVQPSRDNTTAQREIDRLNAELDKLRTELISVNAEKAGLEAQQKQLEIENQNVKTQNEDLTQNELQLTAEKAELESASEAIKTQNQDLTHELTNEKKENAELREKADKVEHRVLQLSNAYSSP